MARGVESAWRDPFQDEPGWILSGLVGWPVNPDSLWLACRYAPLANNTTAMILPYIAPMFCQVDWVQYETRPIDLMIYIIISFILN